MLDTGASHTTFDINGLLVAEYPIGNIVEKEIVETASGLMEVDVIKTISVSAFGHTVRCMNVYMPGEQVPVHIFDGYLIDLNDIFNF